MKYTAESSLSCNRTQTTDIISFWILFIHMNRKEEFKRQMDDKVLVITRSSCNRYLDDEETIRDLLRTIADVWGGVLDSKNSFVWYWDFTICNSVDKWELTTRLRANPPWYDMLLDIERKEIKRLAKIVLWFAWKCFPDTFRD